MTLTYSYSDTWKHSKCENCLKNAHKEEEMSLKKVVSPHDESKFAELFVCSKCGFTRKF